MQKTMNLCVGWQDPAAFLASVFSLGIHLLTSRTLHVFNVGADDLAVIHE